MRALFAFLCLALSAVTLAGAEVYRWVDAEGQVHYSDRPGEGADRVILDIVPAGPASAAGQASPERTKRETGNEASLVYEALTIQAPGQDETLWNIEGQLDVVVTPLPALQAGHRIQLLLDGQTAAELEPGLMRSRLPDVFRGQHSLAARILDEFGTTLKQSDPVTFYVQQGTQQRTNPPPVIQPRGP